MPGGHDSLLPQANTSQNDTSFASHSPVTPHQTPGAPAHMMGQQGQGQSMTTQGQSMTTQGPKLNGKHY